MMNGFPARLATAVLVIFLVVDTCALLPPDGGVGEKSLSNVLNCGSSSSSRKIFPGKEGSFGCENMVVSDKENVAFRDLRSVPWFPPAPLGNRRNSQVSPSPPPII